MNLKNLVIAALCSSAFISIAEAKKRNPCTVRNINKMVGLQYYPILRKQDRVELNVAFMEEADQPGNNPLGLKKGYHYSADDLKRFRGWISDCVDRSKSGRYCFVIDKAAHVIDIYHKGQKIKTYPVGFGLDPYLDKQVQGDLRTPEGQYRITLFKPRSEYYKSLKINYPNADDRKEFRTLRKEDKVLKCDRIGGNIFIHGYGIQKPDERDWTHGCVALTDQNLDDLIRTVKLPSNRSKIDVTIVRYGAREKY